MTPDKLTVVGRNPIDYISVSKILLFENEYFPLTEKTV